MRGLYKFYVSAGRQGELYGLFIASDEEVKQSIGKKKYFNEPFGKHSEWYGEIKEEYITLVSTDPNVLKVIEDHNLETGDSPLLSEEELYEQNESDDEDDD
jgi:hypothetical protein